MAYQRSLYYICMQADFLKKGWYHTCSPPLYVGSARHISSSRTPALCLVIHLQSYFFSDWLQKTRLYTVVWCFFWTWSSRVGQESTQPRLTSLAECISCSSTEALNGMLCSLPVMLRNHLQSRILKIKIMD